MKRENQDVFDLACWGYYHAHKMPIVEIATKFDCATSVISRAITRAESRLVA